MRILHCLESLDPAAGGPARSVPQLALAQARLGHEMGLWAAEGNIEHRTSNIEHRSGKEGGGLADLGKEEVALQRLCGPFAEALLRFGKIDIVHDHGIWLPFHKEIAKECARRRIPRIVSPRGMLEPWALNHKRWKKRLAWWIYQRRDLRSAAALHATADSEAEQLRKLGFRQRIIIAANGVAVDGTSNIEHPTSNLEDRRSKTDQLSTMSSSPLSTPNPQLSTSPKTALFLSRIHPKKGLPLLLEAWSRLRPDGWQLRIVGPDEGGHVAELKRLCEKLGLEWEEVELSVVSGRLSVESACGGASRAHKLTDNGQWTTDNLPLFTDDSSASTLTERRYSAPQHLDPLNIQNSTFKILFSGPIDGEEKWNLMTAADLFVLPTYSENFGIAVAEALACGVPVITTTGAPWAGLLEHRCGWWVAPEVDAIGEALKEAIGLSDDERKSMGARGAEWVREEFAWEGIARKVVEGYEEILNV